MDERLKSALDLSRLIETSSNAKRISYEKFKERTIFYKNGGRFDITKELISFCKTMVDLNQETIVLLDSDNDPIIIENLKDFLNEIVTVYTEASNLYITEIKKINGQKTVNGLINT